MRAAPCDGKLQPMLFTVTPIADSLRGLGWTGKGSRLRDVVTRSPGRRVHPAPPLLCGAAARAAA